MPYSSEIIFSPLARAVLFIASHSSSEVNSGLFLSTRHLPKVKSILDELDESFCFVYGGDVGIYIFAYLTWMIIIKNSLCT